MKTKGPWAISLTLETVSKSNQDLQKLYACNLLHIFYETLKRQYS